MPFLLDTGICSRSLKARPDSNVHSRLIQYGGQLYVSRISCAELYAFGYRAHAKKLAQIDDLLKDLNILEFDDACAREFDDTEAMVQAVNEISEVARTNVQATEAVKRVIEEQTTAVRQMKNATEELTNLSLQLQSVIRRFRTGS